MLPIIAMLGNIEFLNTFHGIKTLKIIQAMNVGRIMFWIEKERISLTGFLKKI